MPRPPGYTVDALLDAAAALSAADRPFAVAMSAVARGMRAPSGSVYQRFPMRAALCGHLSLRTQERFHAGLMAAVARTADPQTSCVAGARYTVGWCREFPNDAQVLLVGSGALGRADWPEDVAIRTQATRRELERAAVVAADPR
jgi:hypothetical protein